MDDKELLELAAKAAGINLRIYRFEPPVEPEEALVWNPLIDDADALRLAVGLNIHIMRYETLTTAQPCRSIHACDERDDGDPYKATRRAITRAAAEIGKGVVTPNVELRGGGPASPARRPA